MSNGAAVLRPLVTVQRPGLRRIWRQVGRITAYALLVALLAFVLLPFFWIISTSLKTQDQTFLVPVQWLPAHPTLLAYRDMWSHHPYTRYFLNSTIVAGTTTLIAVAASCLAAYGFSRFRFRGADWLLLVMIGTQMVPVILLLLSYFKAMSALHLFNTLTALIIAYTAYVLPYTAWILKGYFDSIPTDIDEAAMIDGCSPLTAFLRTVLPVALPGLVATAIFAFLLGWNEFTFAYVLTSTESKYTISVGIAHLFGEYSISWNELMAVGLVASIPPIILYFFTSRFLVSGLTAGALK